MVGSRILQTFEIKHLLVLGRDQNWTRLHQWVVLTVLLQTKSFRYVGGLEIRLEWRTVEWFKEMIEDVLSNCEVPGLSEECGSTELERPESIWLSKSTTVEKSTVESRALDWSKSE